MTQPVAETPEPSQAMSTPASAGPIMRARLNDAELRPTALASSSRVDHLVDERLAGRRVERRAGAEQEREHVDVPRLRRCR